MNLFIILDIETSSWGNMKNIQIIIIWRNPESKVKKVPSSLTFDPAVTIPDKTVNMTTDSLLTRLPREFHQIIKTHSTADLSLNAYETG